jgi:hypothetical protein
MSRCAICGKRTWFWQLCLDSRFGYSHTRCIAERVLQEANAALFKATEAGLRWLIAKGYLRQRLQIPEEKTRITKGTV